MRFPSLRNAQLQQHAAFALHRCRSRAPIIITALAILMIPFFLSTAAQAPTDDHIFLPIIDQGQGSLPASTPTPTDATAGETEAVYGLLGTVQTANGQSFGHYFVTSGNRFYAIVGETPNEEQELGEVADRTPPQSIKVWGQLIPQGGQVVDPNTGESSGTLDLIVASSLLESNGSQVSGPSGAAVTPLTATAKYNAVNLRSGPSMEYAPVGQIQSNDACEVTGRNADASWLLVRCVDGAAGWIDSRFIDVSGSVEDMPVVEAPTITPTPTPSPTPTPIPTPTATQQVFSGWRTAFYNNTSLEGDPVAVINTDAVDFDWGTGSPYPGVTADNFSIRFDRQISFPAGYYRFTVTADDGVRFWLDGQLLIDEWPSASNETYVAGYTLPAGVHDLRLEYYEATGDARIRFTYEFTSAVADWQADYFTNPDLSGNPVFSQAEPRTTDPIDNNWGYGSPRAGVVPIDNWSARWSGRFYFAPGTYRFRAIADDGVRVYIDDTLVLNGWSDGEKDISNLFYGIGTGEHDIRVEFYERSGIAKVRVWWYLDQTPQLE